MEERDRVRVCEPGAAALVEVEVNATKKERMASGAGESPSFSLPQTNNELPWEIAWLIFSRRPKRMRVPRFSAGAYREEGRSMLNWGQVH